MSRFFQAPPSTLTTSNFQSTMPMTSQVQKQRWQTPVKQDSAYFSLSRQNSNLDQEESDATSTFYDSPHSSMGSGRTERSSSTASLGPRHVQNFSGQLAHALMHDRVPVPQPQEARNVKKETGKNAISQTVRRELIYLAEHCVYTWFQCHPSQCGSVAAKYPPLYDFVNYILERTRITTATLALALLYLYRLHTANPTVTGQAGSAHRLLLAAIMLSSKYLYDDSYDNTAWAKVSGGLVDLKEVNAIEMELLDYLEFKIGVARWQWTQWIATLQAWMHQPQGNHFNPQLLAREMCNICSMDEEVRGGGCGTIECLCQQFSTLG